jgi:hypothetical protein
MTHVDVTRKGHVILLSRMGLHIKIDPTEICSEDLDKIKFIGFCVKSAEYLGSVTREPRDIYHYVFTWKVTKTF